MKTGNGKIANLPAKIRDELNWRLNDGEQGNELVDWLNAKPEVMKVVADRFDGIPISEQNLSQWRTHGYRQWHAYRVVLDEIESVSENSEEIAATGIDCEKLLLTLTASYASMIQRWIITPPDEMTYKLRVFKDITNAVMVLRRAEIQKIRLELLREKQASKSASTSASPMSSSTESPSTAKPPCGSRAEHLRVKSSSGENARPQSSAPASALPPPAPSAPPPPAAPGPKPSATRPAAPIPPASVPSPSVPSQPSAPPARSSMRPGGPPPNATPRNPFGLL